MNRTCKGCKTMEKMDKDSDEYKTWLVEHTPVCDKTYTGSAPAMEPNGVIEIFRRSETKHRLRYTDYIGDGDTKSFKMVSESKPYCDDVEIVKKECVGHVQKRMGKALRELKKKTGRAKLQDGKTIGGRGRLTDKEIDQLQIYYGLAIRRNKGNLQQMKREVTAILEHRCSMDENPNHNFCPEGEESWCKFQRDRA